MRDNFSLGPCVGLGAMFITGINNNPLTLLARQLGVGLRHINEDCCELINEEGWRPDPALDKKVEADFNKALDKLTEWRKHYLGTDVALGGTSREIKFDADILAVVVGQTSCRNCTGRYYRRVRGRERRQATLR